MKVFVCLFAIVACANASALYAPAPVAVSTKLLSTGHSTQSRTQDAAGNYRFSYNEQSATGGSSRDESGSGWGGNQAVTGTYTLNVGDGRQRLVKYVADAAGFRAAIATNEPGTAAAPAASTSINSPYLPPQPVQPLPVPVAAPVAVAAPIVAQAPIAAYAPAPIAVAAPIAHAVPAVSSYSSTIDHVAQGPVAIAAPAIHAPILAAPLPAAPALLSGWN